MLGIQIMNSPYLDILDNLLTMLLVELLADRYNYAVKAARRFVQRHGVWRWCTVVAA